MNLHSMLCTYVYSVHMDMDALYSHDLCTCKMRARVERDNKMQREISTENVACVWISEPIPHAFLRFRASSKKKNGSMCHSFLRENNQVISLLHLTELLQKEEQRWRRAKKFFVQVGSTILSVTFGQFSNSQVLSYVY